MSSSAVQRPANTFSVQAPLLGELNAFDLGAELDSSSDFINFEDSFRQRRRQIEIDDQSDGEINPHVGLTESYGEILPSQIMN